MPLAQARGVLIRDARVSTEPSGRVGEWAAAGSTLLIYGELTVRTGLRSPTLLAVGLSTGTRSGWVATDAVEVIEGLVPRLVAGVSLPPGSGGTQLGVPAAGPTPQAQEPGVMASAGTASPLPLWLPRSVSAWEPQIRQAAAEQGLDPTLLAIVVLVESGGWAAARSPVGASGLMQIMPATAAEVVARGAWQGPRPDLATPQGNLRIGASYLAGLARSLGADTRNIGEQQVAQVAAAYNGGPGRLSKHLETGRPLPAETLSYQRWVLGLWSERLEPQSTTLATWQQAGGQRLLDAADALMLSRVTMP